MTRATLIFSIVAIPAVALIACSSGDEHPAPAADPVTEKATNEAVSESSDGGADTRPSPACTPGTQQSCRIYFTTSWGQEQCPESVQFCKSDGTQWMPCGAPATAALE